MIPALSESLHLTRNPHRVRSQAASPEVCGTKIQRILPEPEPDSRGIDRGPALGRSRPCRVSTSVIRPYPALETPHAEARQGTPRARFRCLCLGEKKRKNAPKKEGGKERKGGICCDLFRISPSVYIPVENCKDILHDSCESMMPKAHESISIRDRHLLNSFHHNGRYS